jgi:outer membrane protein TolC
MRFRPFLLSLLATGLVWAGEPAAPLRLSHEQALRLGTTNLLQSRIARELRDEIRQGPEAARGSFDWLLAASAADGKVELGDINPRESGLDNLFLTTSTTTWDARSASLGLTKLDVYGGTVNLSLNTGYNAYGVQMTSQTLPVGPLGSVGFGTTDPYSGSMNLSYTQPLLRGFGREATEAKLRAALDQAKAADESFRARLVQLLTLVDNLYWNQVYASQNLDNKKIALELAQTHLNQDQEQVKSGMLAPLELPQVQAAVADREKQLIAAEAGLANVQQALLENLFPDADRPAALELVDVPQSGPQPLPLAEAKASALAHRPELSQAGYSLAISRTLEKAAKNAVLPQLDTQVAVLRDTTTHADVNGALNDLTQGRYPGYYVGLTFSYPIGNRTRKAQLSQARAATRSSEYLVKDTQTVINLDVEQSYTDLVTARKEVDAADEALRFRLLSLDAEMSKLENGMSTSFYVLQRQDELDQARTADLEARINAEKARTSLARAMGTLVETVE